MRTVLSRRARLLVLLVAGYTAAETTAFVMYAVGAGSLFSRTRAIGELHRVLMDNAPPTNTVAVPSDSRGLYRLHPYLGTVWRREALEKSGEYVSEWNHLAEVDPLAASTDPAIAIVGITGGSVAENLYHSARSTLREILAALPRFSGRKVVFVMLGMSTYAEPQQLQTLTYYLAKGGRLDVLINLDGKNEATHGIVKQRAGLHPDYPYKWKALFNSLNPESAETVAAIGRLKTIRRRLAETVDLLSFSVTALTVWHFLDPYLAECAAEYEQELQHGVPGTSPSPTVTGPPTFQGASLTEIIRYETALWMRSSLQMQHLAAANGFSYFHFLQPSQYYGNKPLSAEEQRRAFAPRSVDRETVQLVYPHLEAALEALRQKGVSAYSLAHLFDADDETRYIDSCCHLNEQGNLLLAREVGGRITRCLQANEC